MVWEWSSFILLQVAVQFSQEHWRDCLFSIVLSCLLCHRFSSVQFSRSVVSDSLWPHESQHVFEFTWVYSNSCPSSWWCHPAISSSVVPFSSCPQSLPASVSFPVTQLFAWGGQSTGVSASSSVLPIDHKWVGFFLGFLLCSIDLYVCILSQYHSVLIYVGL